MLRACGLANDRMGVVLTKGASTSSTEDSSACLRKKCVASGLTLLNVTSSSNQGVNSAMRVSPRLII